MEETEGADARTGRGQSISDQHFRNLLEKRFTVKSGKSDYLSLYRSLARGVRISKSNALFELVNIGHFLLTNSARFTRVLGNDDQSFDNELRKFLPTNQEPGGLFTVQVASAYYEKTIVLIRPAFRIQRYGTEFSSDRPIYLSLHDDGRFSFLKPKVPDPLVNPLPSMQLSPPPPARQNTKRAPSSSSTPASSSPASCKRKATDSTGPSNKKTKSTLTCQFNPPAASLECDSNHVVNLKRSNECGQGIESNSDTGKQQENQTGVDPRVEHNQAIIKEMRKDGPMNRNKRKYPAKAKKNRFFKCPLCEKFIKYNGIYSHINYSCPQNTQKLDRVVKKRQNKTTKQTVKESFECEKCGFSFSEERSLLRHMSSRTNICLRNVETKRIKEEYLVEIYDEGIIGYKCRACDQVLTSMTNFLAHIKNGTCNEKTEQYSHSSELTVLDKDSTSKTPGIQQHCIKLGVWDKDPENLWVDDGDGPKIVYCCRKCCRVFDAMSTYNNHLEKNVCPKKPKTNSRIADKIGNTYVVRPKPFQCLRCSKRFIQKSALETHLNSKTGTCERVAQLRELAIYVDKICIDDHNGRKRFYRCQKCGRVFTRLSGVKSHFGATCAKKYTKSILAEQVEKLIRERNAILERDRSPLSLDKSTECTVEAMKVDAVETANDIQQDNPTGLTTTKRFQCHLCGTGFMRPCRLERHLNSTSGICERTRQNKEMDKKAIKVYVNGAKERILGITCRECSHTYCNIESFRQHIRNNTCNSKQESKDRDGAISDNEQEPGKSYECSKSGTKFARYNNLRQHNNDSRTNVRSRIIEIRQILEECAEKINEDFNGKTMKYKCKKCNNAFPNVKRFVGHVRDKTCKGMDKINPLLSGEDIKAQTKPTCSTCGTSFVDRLSYNFHRVEGRQACESNLNRKRFIEDYVKEIPSGKLKSEVSYECKKCNSIVSSITYLQEHAARGKCKGMPNQGNNQIVYTWKGKTFSSYKAYRDCVTAEKHKIIFAKDDNTQIVQCLLCLRPFNTEDALEYHFRVYCSNYVSKTVNCTVCTSRLKSLEDFVEHVRKKHGTETNREEQEEERQCPLCYGLFTTLNLLDHLSNGTCTKKPVPKCPSCRIELDNESSVIKFQDDDIAYYSCAKCNFRFSVIQTTQLDLHIGWEENRTPYKCNVCGQSFGSESRLKLHYCPRMHTCDYCESYFGSPAGLKRHKCPQNPKNPTFGCVFCGKEFGFQCDLDNHIRWHNQEYDVSCDVCGKVYKTEQCLHRHKKAKHGSRICDLCGIDNLPNAYMCTAVLHHSNNCYKRLCLGELDYEPYQRVTCNECKKQFYAFDYHRHLQNHILKSMKMIKIRAYPCPKCDCAFTLKKDLLLHDHIHLAVDEIKRQAENLKCDHCGRIFGTSLGLKIHSKHCKSKDITSRNEEASKPNTDQFEPNIYQCCQCLETADCRDQMMEHCSKVHGVQVPMDFNDVRSRIKIELTNDGPYCCFVCEQSYSCGVFQRMHTRICQDRFGEKILNSKPGQLPQPPESPDLKE